MFTKSTIDILSKQVSRILKFTFNDPAQCHHKEPLASVAKASMYLRRFMQILTRNHLNVRQAGAQMVKTLLKVLVSIFTIRESKPTCRHILRKNWTYASASVPNWTKRHCMHSQWENKLRSKSKRNRCLKSAKMKTFSLNKRQVSKAWENTKMAQKLSSLRMHN